MVGNVFEQAPRSERIDWRQQATSRAGCGTSPICACMARLRSRRRDASSETSARRLRRLPPGLHSCRCEELTRRVHSDACIELGPLAEYESALGGR